MGNATYQEVLNALAPCGLSCHKCFAFNDGEISRLAKELQRYLGAFNRYAARFSKMEGLGIFECYPQFKKMLSYFAQGDCSGCRTGTCKYPNCGVIECYRKKGVDFCFQCDEFPCDKTNFDPDLHKRWIKMNERLKEIGAEAYFEETLDTPRYR